MVNVTTLLGVVLLARHGDRVEFFQDPFTYNPDQTFLTGFLDYVDGIRSS